MPAVSGSVADLFASLGLDTTAFYAGLNQAKRDMQASAYDMAKSVQLVRDLLTTMGRDKNLGAAAFGSPEIKSAVKELEAYGIRLREMTRLDQEFQRSIRNRTLVMQRAAANDRRMEADAVAMDRRHAMQRQTDIRSLQREFSSAIGRRDRLDPQDDGTGTGGGGGSGGQMLVTRLTERFLIYHALRAAVRGVVDVFKEAEDITRRMDQTGWGSRGVQQLATAAREINTPVESVVSAIGHLQTQVEAPDIGLLKVFDRLGIKYTELRRVMEQNPQGGFEQVATAMSHVRDHGQLAIDVMTVFGDRTGKLIEFITHWNDLKKEAEKTPVISDADIKNMNEFWRIVARIEAMGARGVVGAVGGARAAWRGAGDFLMGISGRDVELPMRGIEGRPTMGINSSTLGQGLSITPAPLPTDAKSLDNARRILDEYRASHELATRKMAEDYNTMLLLERQGLASRAQVEEFRTRANMKLREEEWKQYEEIFRKMTKTTTDYYNTLQEIAERPGLKEAMKWFERGLIDREELMRAKMRAKAGAGLSEAEQRFMRDDDMDPQELMNAFRQWQGETNYYRSRLQLPLAPPMPRNPFQGSTPGGPSQIITARPEGSMGASINLVPLDQFSESMVRHWMRQGMTTS